MNIRGYVLGWFTRKFDGVLPGARKTAVHIEISSIYGTQFVVIEYVVASDQPQILLIQLLKAGTPIYSPY